MNNKCTVSAGWCTGIAAALAIAAVNWVSSPRAVAQDALSDSLGTVNFSVSCNPDVNPKIVRGVAALHHMMYSSSRELFAEAAESDSDCAIALWGNAMTYIHPLWPDRPTSNEIEIGRKLVAEATTIGGHDDRENAYIDTVAAYFGTADNRTERERLVDFDAAWQRLCRRHPNDIEAQAFCALAQLATVDATDKSYSKQLAAGASVEEILRANPDHPGAHHYIIHAYDLPALAERALPVARNYGRVAPAVTHALHMMTHIFTRQGLWDESIEWNRRSADAALATSEDLGALSLHYLHALDYLAYAYLQQGTDDAALDVVNTAAALTPPFETVNQDAGAYAFAAIPARYALERRDWALAARLEARTPVSFSWNDTQTHYIAITHFARALGFAHTGDFSSAAREIDVLNDISERLRNPYWATQVEIQSLSAHAWLDYLQGRSDDALKKMQLATELELGTNKHPITPGEVLPATELLGDMLLDLGRNSEALEAFDDSLARSPARFNSLLGAARAARALGHQSRAAGYFREIAAFASASPRPAISEATQFIASLGAARQRSPTSIKDDSTVPR